MYFKEASQYYKEMTSTITNLDTSEGSPIYIALMPTCYEMSYQGLMLDEVVKQVYIKEALDNGYDEFVKKRAAEQGIFPTEATTATGVLKVIGVVGSTLPANVLVGTIGGVTYTTDSAVTLDSTGIGYVNITASGTGSKYNCDVGAITVLGTSYVGITSITNETKIDNGYDDQTMQSLYDEYLEYKQNPATSANKAQYEKWALSVTGVGKVKVYPTWNGGGTVKVVITNSNMKGADADLVNAVETYINSVVPINSGVLTVNSATEKDINVSLTLDYDTVNYNLDTIKANISSAITSYLNSISFKQLYVSINKIASVILTTEGVNDCSNLTLNGGTTNATLADEDIPVIGSVVVA